MASDSDAVAVDDAHVHELADRGFGACAELLHKGLVGLFIAFA
jgi:hypothetical protein